MKKKGIEDKTDDGVYWMNINSPTHWEVILFDVKIGDDKVTLGSSKLIFDSGTSLIYTPSAPYNSIMAAIFKNHKCSHEDTSDLYVCSCSSNRDASFPTISIQVGSKKDQYWFYLKG